MHRTKRNKAASGLRSKRSGDTQRYGQTIIEAMIALASILITLAAISVVITASLSNSGFIRDQSLASRYAQEGMEYMRYLRNIDPSSFEARQGIYCMGKDNMLDAGTCPSANIDSAYKREVEFIQNSPIECSGGTKITVSVYWASGKCSVSDRFCHKSQLISCFAKQSGQGTEL